MSTFGERLMAAFMAESSALGRKLNNAEIVKIADAQFKICTKERKRAAIDPRAASILNVYPRREGGDAALLSITKSIASDGFDLVLQKTTEYANAVARWSWSRKKSQSGASLIPMATTWYNNRRYLDDSSEWWSGTGGKAVLEKKEILKEPSGWRDKFPDFINRDKPWKELDEATQKHIVAQCIQSSSIGL